MLSDGLAVADLICHMNEIHLAAVLTHCVDEEEEEAKTSRVVKKKKGEVKVKHN